MVKFLSMETVCGSIVDIITNADKFVTIVSPFLQFPPKVLSYMKKASQSGVKLTIYYKSPKDMRKREREKAEAQLKLVEEQINFVNLYSVSKLHSKCYFN